MKTMKRILIIIGHYVPGYNDGGPVRSIKNLTDYLGKEYKFRILTEDRDFGDEKPYPGIKVNDWNQVGNAQVYYVPPKKFTLETIRVLANDVDLVYVTGCFSDYAIKAMVLKRFNIIKVPLVIASMGMFSPMAFKIKYKKKKIYAETFNILGMFKNVYWSVTSEMEKNEVLQQINAKEDSFYIAEDLPRKVDATLINKQKTTGHLKIVWISRISPKKNLLGAIEILQEIVADISFTIFGPIYDNDYWNECKNALDNLPQNIHWSYCGNIESEDVVDRLKEFHVFLFPTFGENYGHVIQEALSAGCACVISDQTPWKDLEKNNLGYVISIHDYTKFRYAINKYASLSNDELNILANDIHNYAVAVSNNSDNKSGYRPMFDSLCG